jgi:osmotically-inducible protein OsmY
VEHERAVVNATVKKGIARIYGWVASDIEHRALQVVAENTPGVLGVKDHLQRARLFI